jgi:dihydrofolate reductase
LSEAPDRSVPATSTADPDDGCDELFGFYQSGDVAVKLSEGFPELHVPQATAGLLAASVAKAGATVVGRRLYDLTNGWGGHPGGEVPMVVVTHHPPQDWPRGGVPVFFETSIEAAVATARELVGAKDVDIAGATITRGCLDAGLLDVIQASLVPVILGEGIPWLAGARGPVRLSDPEVVEDRGVTHLRYVVCKTSAGPAPVPGKGAR